MNIISNFSLFESQSDIVDSLMDRVKSYNIDKDYKLSIGRPNSGMFGKGETPGKSYRVALVDRKTNKVVSVAYVMEIKKNKEGMIQAQVRRVHTEKNSRGKGLMNIVLRELVKNFGDLYLFLYASPNRIDELTDKNREEYRNKLF